ncbi:hypothetical protein [Coraliomargarita akajimensis]|nr:hypothetical protein [Coraliomargarita akajimensis]
MKCPTMYPVRLIAVVLVWMLSSLPTVLAQTVDSDGYNCLFLGHSFFAPIVKHLDAHARACGFREHQQFVVFHGGANGAPGKLWQSPKADVLQAKRLIESGRVDLIGLTSHYVGSEVTDYKRWVDLALAHNPETIFVIQAPWDIKQGKDFPTYAGSVSFILKGVHALIDELRSAYPGVTFLSVPQGGWMVELWRLYDANQLPELKEFVAENPKKAKRALFRDAFGHGGALAEKEGALLWLRVIYQVDLTRYRYDTRVGFDLKQLAQDICEADAYSKRVQ